MDHELLHGVRHFAVEGGVRHVGQREHGLLGLRPDGRLGLVDDQSTSSAVHEVRWIFFLC
jgi:hypothetical protein